jgi:N6-L-threonylcarbamoyladenine synthase
MIILGIETSCDETSAAVVDDHHILSNIIATQAIHQEYGGVVPEFASRAHIRQLIPIIKKALFKAKVGFDDLDGLAVTYGPGLAGSLLVGLCVAKGISSSMSIPYIGVNHLEGHVTAAQADPVNLDYPYISLVVSGGHTLLVRVTAPLEYQIVGTTIDDAAGEAFDKVAKILNLGYPGGPNIEKAATAGDPDAIAFPRALLDQDNLDFSFSGLKTAVLYYVKSLTPDQLNQQLPDIAASFQKAVIDVLVNKSIRAIQKYHCKQLFLGGGVARNNSLRHEFNNKCKESAVKLFVPEPELCTDNAAMIARAGHLRLQTGEKSTHELDVIPNLTLL